MRTELKTVLDTLPKLTADELQRVRSGLAALSSLGGAKPIVRGPEDDADWVLLGITSFMQNAGLDMSGPAQLRGSHFAAFRNKMPALMHFINRAGDKNKQRALLHLGLDLLHENMTAIGLAVTSRTLMQHVHRIPGVIDRSFPGYAQAGLLPLIIATTKGKVNVRKK
jgi:hypothetical protein